VNPVKHLSDDKLAIFLFHGVMDASNYSVRNYTRKHMNKETFVYLVQQLRLYGRCISMADVVAHHLHEEPFPPKAFVITFDDGFANNYTIAAPILADERMSAIFYITTGFVVQNLMAWIDRIEYCFEITKSGRLKLPWKADIDYFDCIQDKIRLLDEIRVTVKRDPDIDIENLVDEIFCQCGIQPITESDEPLDKKLTWEQIRTLNASQRFMIGGHTHTHAIMSFLDPGELETEIATSMRLLKERAGVFTNHYSYPEGLKHCYSEEVICMLKRFGITCCPTAIEGKNSIETDLFHLNRIMMTEERVF